MALQRQTTLERRLQAYVTKALPPPTTARQVKRRETLKTRVIRQCLRQLRCLARQGNERGWTTHELTAEDLARQAGLEATWRQHQIPLDEKGP